MCYFRVIFGRSHRTKQERQSTCNVKFRRDRETIVAAEKNLYYTTCVCICILRYLACKTHAPYCHLWPAPLYSTFPRYLKKTARLKIKVIEMKCAFRVSLQLLPEAFFIIRRAERDMIENVYWYSCKVPLILARI